MWARLAIHHGAANHCCSGCGQLSWEATHHRQTPELFYRLQMEAVLMGKAGYEMVSLKLPNYASTAYLNDTSPGSFPEYGNPLESFLPGSLV